MDKRRQDGAVPGSSPSTFPCPGKTRVDCAGATRPPMEKNRNPPSHTYHPAPDPPMSRPLPSHSRAQDIKAAPGGRAEPTSLAPPHVQDPGTSSENAGANFLSPSSCAGPRNLVRERRSELPCPLLLCGPRNVAQERRSDFVGLHRRRLVNLTPPSHWFVNKVFFCLAYLPFLWHLLWGSH